LVAHRLEDVTVIRFDRRSKEFIVPAQRFGHHGTFLFPVPRATLDIGEQQRYCPARNGGS
jgi:hypothetical protein